MISKIIIFLMAERATPNLIEDRRCRHNTAKSNAANIQHNRNESGTSKKGEEIRKKGIEKGVPNTDDGRETNSIL